MAKFSITTTAVLVLGLIGSAHSQGNGGPLGNLLAPVTGLLGGGGAGGNPLAPVTNLLGGGGGGGAGGNLLAPVTDLLGGGGGAGGNPLGAVTGLLNGSQGGQGGNPLGAVTGLLGGQGQNGANPLGGLTNVLGPDGLNNLLGSLPGGLGGPAGQQQPQGAGGLSELLRRLPQRGLELVQAILNSVRNILPNGNMGRNGQQQQQQQLPRNPMDAMNGQMPLNMPNPFSMNGQMGNAPNGAGDPLGLNGLTRPVTDMLSNGGLPDVNQLTNQLTRTLSGGNSNGQPMGISTPMSNTLPAVQAVQ